MTCVQCCARLLVSARPLRRAQQAMLAAIARHQGAPSKAAILQAIKSLDADLQSSNTHTSGAFIGTHR